jgi:phage major head subunit gpT-like protein
MPGAGARTRHTNTPDNHHLHFLQIQQAKQLEKAPKPAALSVEQHAANWERLGTVRFVKPKYSAETEINVLRHLWKIETVPQDRLRAPSWKLQLTLMQLLRGDEGRRLASHNC